MELKQEIRVLTASLIGVAIMSSLVIIEPQNSLKDYNEYHPIVLPLFSETPLSEGGPGLQDSRLEWQRARLADPATGEIPKGIRKKELAFIRNLNQMSKMAPPGNPEFAWEARGPYNVGGRTRAFAIDVTNESVMLAGGVSGGLWRSIDAGTTWEKVTAPHQHHSITCIAQDTRVGKTNVWYYGTGETYGNSASKSPSSIYLGSGMYKSTDGGLNWDAISSTVSGTPEKTDPWDHIWRVAVDATVDTADIVYAALESYIYRSTDGGTSWTVALAAAGLGGSIFSEVDVSPAGIAFATVSGGSDKGIWRSGDHGNSWTKISSGSGWPSNFNRAVIGISPVNENIVYFLSNTPGYGQFSSTFFGGSEYNSLWKYEYLSGDGGDSTNSIWTNLSLNIPAGGLPFNNFNAQGSYNLVVAVKPDDPNTVFIGGTNLYRSSDGFTTPNNTTQIGGYQESTTLPYFQMYPNHHPDNHEMVFLPSDPNILFSATDGGVFRTDNCLSSSVSWAPLNNGYQTTQFYTLAIDHGPSNNDIIFGGLQDNGTFWTNSSDPTASWVMPSTGDGSYCALADDGTYYFSRQKGKVLKSILDQNGTPTAFNRIDPITGDAGDYLFINPFILDPVDNNIMYLAEMFDLWRNDDLSSIPLANEYDSISTGWTQLTNIVPMTSNYITTLACSKSNPEHRLYYGANNTHIYRIDSAHVGNPVSTNIKSNITSGGYTSCIAIDPRDADKVLVVYSNYNAYSLWYTEDGGGNWARVAGNLETGPPPGAPTTVNLDHLGDGPSTRSAAIIPLGPDSTLYLLGTSVGLFTTYELIPDSIPGDSTHWIPQAALSIGNVVADVIKFRESDGFMVIGTHGSGVYSTYLDSIVGAVAPLEERLNMNVNVFPNPASEHTTFSFELKEKTRVTISIYDSSGRRLADLGNADLTKGSHQIEYNTSGLSTGVYLYSLTTESGKVSGRLIVN